MSAIKALQPGPKADRWVERACRECGASFFVSKAYLKWAKGNFCSTECSNGSRGRWREDRFFASVKVVGDCWEWTGARGPTGYGLVDVPHMKRQVKAHRYAWILKNGDIPAGMSVCHRCDNRPCINPSHLFIGTHLDNVRDMDAKGRRRVGDSPKGDRHYGAIVTSAIVTEIRRLFSEGHSFDALASQFGLKYNHVRKIVRRYIWRHLP